MNYILCTFCAYSRDVTVPFLRYTPGMYTQRYTSLPNLVFSLQPLAVFFLSPLSCVFSLIPIFRYFFPFFHQVDLFVSSTLVVSVNVGTRDGLAVRLFILFMHFFPVSTRFCWDFMFFFCGEFEEQGNSCGLMGGIYYSHIRVMFLIRYWELEVVGLIIQFKGRAR